MAAALMVVASGCGSSGSAGVSETAAAAKATSTTHAQRPAATTTTTTTIDLTKLDPQPAQTIDVGSYPAGIAHTPGAVWVLSLTNCARMRGATEAVRIDPATNKVVARVGVGGCPQDIVATDDGLWVPTSKGTEDDGIKARLVHIDPATNKVDDAIELGPGDLYGLAVTPTDFWVTLVPMDVSEPAHLLRIDRTSHNVSKRLPLEGRPMGISAADSGLWLASQGTSDVSGTLEHRNAMTGKVVATTPLDWAAPTIVATGNAVWLASAGQVVRVDPKTNRVVATIPVGTAIWDLGVAGLAVDGNAVWAANYSDGTLALIDPATNKVVATGKGMPAMALTVEGGSVWGSDGAAFAIRVPT